MIGRQTPRFPVTTSLTPINQTLTSRSSGSSLKGVPYCNKRSPLLGDLSEPPSYPKTWSGILDFCINSFTESLVVELAESEFTRVFPLPLGGSGVSSHADNGTAFASSSLAYKTAVATSQHEILLALDNIYPAGRANHEQ